MLSRRLHAAVDAANDGDVIKVAAGTYTAVSVRPRSDVTTTGVVTQLIYISKTLTLQGGYTTTKGFAHPPDPMLNPTTLDALAQGRVVYITGDVSPTIEGLRPTGGNAAGLDGDPNLGSIQAAGCMSSLPQLQSATPGSTITPLRGEERPSAPVWVRQPCSSVMVEYRGRGDKTITFHDTRSDIPDLGVVPKAPPQVLGRIQAADLGGDYSCTDPGQINALLGEVKPQVEDNSDD